MSYVCSVVSNLCTTKICFSCATTGNTTLITNARLAGTLSRDLALVLYMPDFIHVSIGTRAENERFLTVLRKVLAELDQETIELSWSAEQPTDKVKV